MNLAEKLKNLGEIKESGWSIEEEGKVAETILPNSDHKIYFKREKRKGKIVILCGEFFVPDQQEILKIIKKKLAVGGSVEARFLMLQSDNETKIKEIIKELGFGLKKP